MKLIKSSFLILSIFFSWAFLDQPFSPQTIHFDIRPSSKLLLNGTSNINTFSCDCENYNHSGNVSMSASSKGYWEFKDALLKVRVDAFDCGHSGINRDMGRALRSDKYPNILISLKTILHENTLDNFPIGEHRTVHTIVDISLAGQTRQVPLYITVQHLGENEYQITAEKDLYMSDFGVEPPTALFGLIKVNDLINISFDLDLVTRIR